MTDPSAHVRIAAAEALGQYGTDEDLQDSLALLISVADSVKNGTYVALYALNAIDALGKKAVPLKAQIAALTTFDPKSPARVNSEYTTKMVDWLKTKLG
jgi:hypothetical protein